MAPLISLSLLLLAAQIAAAVIAIRRKLWRKLPLWTFYVCLATVHVIFGLVMTTTGSAYPMSILYGEPLIIFGQIAIVFESSVRYLRGGIGGGSPEGRLLSLLIPLVPLAIVLPLETQFLGEVLSDWQNSESDALMKLYSIREFLSVSLFTILAVVPLVARFNKTVAPPALVTHHRVLTAYLACGALGYLGKSRPFREWDAFVMNAFFLVGPTLCFLVWSRRMGSRQPADFASPRVHPTSEGPSGLNERHGSLQFT